MYGRVLYVYTLCSLLSVFTSRPIIAHIFCDPSLAPPRFIGCVNLTGFYASVNHDYILLDVTIRTDVIDECSSTVSLSIVTVLWCLCLLKTLSSLTVNVFLIVEFIVLSLNRIQIGLYLQGYDQRCMILTCRPRYICTNFYHCSEQSKTTSVWCRWYLIWHHGL